MTPAQFQQIVLEKLEGFEQKFRTLERKVEDVGSLLATTATTVHKLEQDVHVIKQKINKLDTRLKHVEEKMSNLDTRLKGVEGRIDGINTRIERIDTRLEQVEKTIGGLDIRLKNVEKRVNDINVRLASVEGRMGDFDTRLRGVEDSNDRLFAWAETEMADKAKLIQENAYMYTDMEVSKHETRFHSTA